MESWFDKKMIFSIVGALVVVFVLAMIYRKVTGTSTATVGTTITADQFAALSVTDQANYTKNADGTYTKKS